ncbi:MAG TPA: DUF1573 domain-containing protein [Opitutaceae bacterium]|nr:DUF1573 domain-containing protein [Opitutaceae bacterium]
MAGRAIKALALLAVGLLAAAAAPAPAAPDAAGLAWDRTEAVSRASPGQDQADFVFTARNPTARPIVVQGISSSCRCTEAWFPASPLTIPPGGTSPLRALVHLSGQRGEVVKQVYVDTDAGSSTLTLKIEVPAGAAP